MFLNKKKTIMQSITFLSSTLDFIIDSLCHHTFNDFNRHLNYRFALVGHASSRANRQKNKDLIT